MENSKWAINLMSTSNLSDKYYMAKDVRKKEVETFLQASRMKYCLNILLISEKIYVDCLSCRYGSFSVFTTSIIMQSTLS